MNKYNILVTFILLLTNAGIMSSQETNDNIFEFIKKNGKTVNTELQSEVLPQEEGENTEDASQQIADLNARIQELENQVSTLESQVESSDKALVTLASNFMYIPYEKYSIEEIAVPAFDKIHTPEIRAKYQNRYVILSSYQNHVKELKAFLEDTNKKLSGPALLRPSAQELKKSLKSLQIYKDYSAYNDWQNTYLGKFLKHVESTIDKVQNESVNNAFGNLIKELNELNIK